MTGRGERADLAPDARVEREEPLADDADPGHDDRRQLSTGQSGGRGFVNHARTLCPAGLC
jgi:hypothetical protein